jgi:hypothetical protein
LLRSRLLPLQGCIGATDMTATVDPTSVRRLTRPRAASHRRRPGFIWPQGDRLARVLTTRKQDDYQRLRSWNEAGYSLFAGTDAPFRTPWL